MQLLLCTLHSTPCLYCSSRHRLGNAALNEGCCHVNDAALPRVYLKPQLLLDLHSPTPHHQQVTLRNSWRGVYPHALVANLSCKVADLTLCMRSCKHAFLVHHSHNLLHVLMGSSVTPTVDSVLLVCLCHGYSMSTIETVTVAEQCPTLACSSTASGGQ